MQDAAAPVIEIRNLHKSYGSLEVLKGVDIAAPAGLPVQVMAPGLVVRSGTDGGYGRFVEVRHADGLTSLYAHLGSIDPAVKPRAWLARGASVGRIGSSGTSTGAHLHFEVRDKRDRPLNPVFFMGREYADKDDLPLKAAARVPRNVRLAYVSFIPASKRQLMEEREAEKAEAEAERKAAREAARLARAEAAKAAVDPKILPVPKSGAQASNVEAFASEAAARTTVFGATGADGRVHGSLEILEVNRPGD